LHGKPLQDIVDLSFDKAIKDLNANTEEDQFFLHIELDALKCALAQFIGNETDNIDKDRCHIESIKEKEEGSEITVILLPPKDLPKI